MAAKMNRLRSQRVLSQKQVRSGNWNATPSSQRLDNSGSRKNEREVPRTANRKPLTANRKPLNELAQSFRSLYRRTERVFTRVLCRAFGAQTKPVCWDSF